MRPEGEPTATDAADRASEPVVDIFLPTYGSAPYLGHALRSVVAQSESAWRLTLVDNSPEIGDAMRELEPYRSDPRVRYVETGGLSQPANWTVGMQSGDAPYVTLLCDDDWWEPDFLRNRLEFLRVHPRCGFVFSTYREVDENDTEIALRAPRLPEGVHEPHFLAPKQYQRNLVPVATVMWRRTALRAVGEKYADVRVPDVELSMRLVVRFPAGYLHLRDCNARMHSGSVTSTLLHRGRGKLDYLDHFDRTIDAVDPTLVPDAIRARRRANDHLTASLDAVDEGDAADALRHLRQALRRRPGAVADPRVGAVLFSLAAGARGRRWLGALRRLQRRRHVRLHPRDLRFLLDDVAYRARRLMGGHGDEARRGARAN